MTRNCKTCIANCENTGNPESNPCKKYKQKKAYEIETDSLLAFPDMIVVHSTKSDMEKVFLRGD